MSASFTPGPWEADFGTEGYFFLTHSDGLELPQTRENLAMLGAATDLFEALSELMPRNLGKLPATMPDSATLPLDVTFGELRRAIAALAKSRGEG